MNLRSIYFILLVLSISDPALCKEPTQVKTGVLLVNHGSRSAAWRSALLELDHAVRDSLLALPTVAGVKTAFMEYTEPSVATRLKEMDEEGYTDIIIVPVFLTVSPHTVDDLPTIIGQKSNSGTVQQLKMERIERYTPKARYVITPTLDFSSFLKENIVRRVKGLSRDAAQEGIVLVAYGDHTYEKEWIALLQEAAEQVRKKTGITSWSYAWCGHIAQYDPARTTDAVELVLKERPRALVFPVLLAYDEMFQGGVIRNGVENVRNAVQRVVYKPDALLPDANLVRWIIRSVETQVALPDRAGDMVGGRKK